MSEEGKGVWKKMPIREGVLSLRESEEGTSMSW